LHRGRRGRPHYGQNNTHGQDFRRRATSVDDAREEGRNNAMIPRRVAITWLQMVLVSKDLLRGLGCP
jgi:hypothetical protein